MVYLSSSSLEMPGVIVKFVQSLPRRHHNSITLTEIIIQYCRMEFETSTSSLVQPWIIRLTNSRFQWRLFCLSRTNITGPSGVSQRGCELYLEPLPRDSPWSSRCRSPRPTVRNHCRTQYGRCGCACDAHHAKLPTKLYQYDNHHGSAACTASCSFWLGNAAYLQQRQWILAKSICRQVGEQQSVMACYTYLHCRWWSG